MRCNLPESVQDVPMIDSSALRLRDDLLTAVTESLRDLLSGRDFDLAVAKTLKRFGEIAGIHRVKVILQDPFEPGAQRCHRLTYEWWAKGLKSQASHGISVFNDEDMPGYLDVMKRGEGLSQTIEEVPEPLREVFKRVGMLSMGVVPIFSGETYLGLIAFDDCARRRVYSGAEMDALAIAAQALGAAIYRRQLEDAEREARAAVALERSRMAREIHDTLAQSFSGIILQLRAMAGAGEDHTPQSRQHRENALELALNGLSQTRQSLSALRQTDFNGQSLRAALKMMANSVENLYSISVRLNIPEDIGLATEVEFEILRIAQESVTNTMKHASARLVTVSLTHVGHDVVLCVSDDGRGFDAGSPTEGFGLIGIRERAAKIGAELTLNSGQQGTTVCVRVPGERLRG
jgi:signal transduction histidine kinase